MHSVLYYICLPLGYLMKGCFLLIKNYGIAIILFTLITKIVLMPISVWIQKNSILMVKIQPQINFIKARLSGNFDAIAEEQTKLYKKEKYHPFASIIPLIIQIVLLLGVVYVINRPLEYLFGASNDTINALANFINADTSDSSFQIQIIEAIKNGTISTSSVITGGGIDANVLGDLIGRVMQFNTGFCGLDLLVVTSQVGGWYVLVPIIAALSSWVMCYTQNRSNVIQHEQGKINKYGIMILSVGLSLVLGIFVPTATALYWTASNLLSIAVMYLLNALINPKKYVDYEALEASRKALAESKAFGVIDKKDPLYKQMKAKEKEDYKKFKHIINKHIVFYSEKSGFYKYYKNIIDELLKSSDVVIHYVTNDYEDAIFEIAKSEPRIKPYFISLKKTALLMMLVEADIFIMTTPDLDKYYLKRSFIKKDIEYIYVPHDSMSVHMGFKEGALDAFDTIFCSGPHVAKEIRATEQVYKLKEKTLVEFGFPLLDNLVEDFKKKERDDADKNNHKRKEILIAPTWNEDNILDSCIDDIIKSLGNSNCHLTIRPHPEYVKRFKVQMNELVEKYKDYDKNKLSFELDFSSNKSIYSSDLLITDWSGISAEFAFATSKPVLFINTKMKTLNPNWEKIGITPVEIQLRDIIGVNINKEEIGKLPEVIDDLFKNRDKYKKQIDEFYQTFTYNHGHAGKEGAKYILKSLITKQNNKKQ